MLLAGRAARGCDGMPSQSNIIALSRRAVLCRGMSRSAGQYEYADDSAEWIGDFLRPGLDRLCIGQDPLVRRRLLVFGIFRWHRFGIGDRAVCYGFILRRIRLMSALAAVRFAEHSYISSNMCSYIFRFCGGNLSRGERSVGSSFMARPSLPRRP